MTPNRPLLVCLVLLATVLAPAGEALACVCARVGSPCAAIEDSDAVMFSGTALDVSRAGHSADVPAFTDREGRWNRRSP
jgi:hypothetical protein